MSRRIACVAVLGALACAVPRPSSLPRDEPWLVAVKSAGIPEFMPWYARFAVHTWVDVKAGSEERWTRYEVTGATSGVVVQPIAASMARADRRWGDEGVRLLRSIDGERAREIAAEIELLARAHDRPYRAGYAAWPGPNSNTFLRELGRESRELAFTFEHNAVGKDYAPFLALGAAPSKTGLGFDTWLAGCTLAIEEGFELHLLQFDCGLQLFPPRLKLPFLPEIPWSRTVDLSTPPAPATRHRDSLECATDVCTLRARVAGEWLAEDDILFEAPEFGVWLRLSTRIEAATADEPEGAVQCKLTLQGEVRQELHARARFEGGTARLGPFEVEVLSAQLTLQRDSNGKLSASYELELDRTP